jgi:uncharacterized protein (DUF111 family)
MEESTTLGCRVEKVTRVTVDRESRSHDLSIEANGKTFSGQIVAKHIKWRPDVDANRQQSRPRFKIEHDDLKRLAETLGISLHEARRLAVKGIEDKENK